MKRLDNERYKAFTQFGLAVALTLRREIKHVQIYKNETREIVCQLHEYRISQTECKAALDAALVGVVQRMKPRELPAVRFEILRNYGLVSEHARKSEPMGSALQDYITVQ